jgi:integrase
LACQCIPAVHTFSATDHNAMPAKAQFRKSKVPCLFLHSGGKYYAISKVSGKLIRRSLDTDDYATASARLDGVLAEMRGAKNAASAGSLGAALRKEAYRDDPTIKPTTRIYYQERCNALERTADSLPINPLNLSLSRVTVADLRQLMDKYSTTASATSYNGSLSLLRRTFEKAMEAGFCGSNPALKIKRLKAKKMKHDLPTAESFAEIVADILSQRKAYSKAAAFSVEFLAYTGMRISEAVSVRWRDIKADHVTVRTAKNDGFRQIPLIPACKGLLERMRASVIPTRAEDPVMLLKSPREALKGACERLGIDHMRVHDLRHLFATRCIEAGIDLPTIAAWLGHTDGGVLCTQVYGHLCKKHSTAMAGRVKA